MMSPWRAPAEMKKKLTPTKNKVLTKISVLTLKKATFSYNLTKSVIFKRKSRPPKAVFMSGLFERGPLKIKLSGRLLERLRYKPIEAVAVAAKFHFITAEEQAERFFFTEGIRT